MARKLFLTIVLFVALISSAFALGKPTVANVTLTLAGTEYTYTIPPRATAITIQSRTAADFKVSGTSGESGTTYFTVKAGTTYYETSVDNYGGKLYLQSANAGQVIEIIYWANN
jgi:hypothetical protein